MADSPAPETSLVHKTSELLKEIFTNRKQGTLRTIFIQGAAGTFGLKVAFSGLSLLLNVLLTRFLGPAGYGAYTYAFAWAVLLGVPSMLGMDQVLVRAFAAYNVEAAFGKMRGMLRRANLAVFAASISAALVALAISWFLQRPRDSTMLLTFWIALALVPIITLTRVRQSALQGLHRVIVGSVPEMIIHPLALIVMVVAGRIVLGKLTAPWAMSMNLVSSALAFLIGAYLLRKLLPQPVRGATPVFTKFAWVNSILPLMFFASANFVYGQADVLVLGSIKGSVAVGYYGVADRSAELINFVAVAVSSALAPAVAALYAQKDSARLQAMVKKVVRVTFFLSLPIGLVLMLFGHWWLLLLYGPAFTYARRSLAILSLGQLVSTAAGPAGLLLVMTGHEADAAWAIAISAVGNIALCALLIPRWDAEGAAVAAATSAVLWSILLARAVRRRLSIDSTLMGSAL